MIMGKFNKIFLYSTYFLCCFSSKDCLLYTSDAADERSSVDLGGRRIIKKKKHKCLAGLPIVRNITHQKTDKDNISKQYIITREDR